MRSTKSPGDSRRHLASCSLFALAFLFVTNPLTHILGGLNPHTSHAAIAWSGFLAPVHMALMIGAVLAITQILRGSADRRGLIGGALTLMGWTAGVRILALAQAGRVLQGGVEGVPADALSRIYASAPIVFISLIPIGLMFPAGLITLGLTLFAKHPIHRGIGALLALGGLFFPIGRAIGQPWAWLACDLSLAAAFALIGAQLLTRPALWRGETAAHDPRSTLLETPLPASA